MTGSSVEATDEFSRILTPDRLSGSNVTESIEASPAECAAVARRLGILSVDRLTAQVTAKSFGSDLVRVQGAWEAAVQQACVVTLEPVAQEISGEIDVSYEVAGGHGGGAGGGEVLVDPEGADPAEVLPIDGVDLGELVVQELAVALDPYPRVAGAEVPAEYRPPEVEEEEGPFSALKVLKSGK